GEQDQDDDFHGRLADSVCPRRAEAVLSLAFRPRLVPTAAALAMIALTLYLGRWQTHRAQEKELLQALYDTRTHEPAVRLAGSSAGADLLYRRVIASGRWI